MVATCKFCRSSQRAAYERELANGASYRDIAAKLDIDIASVSRHVNNCIPGKIAKAVEKRDISDGINAIDALVERDRVVADQIKRALAIDDVALSIKWTLKAIETGLKVTELSVRLSGELNGPSTSVNVLMNNPDFVWLRDSVINSLPVEDQVRLTEKLQAMKELEQ
jgi:transposase